MHEDIIYPGFHCVSSRLHTIASQVWRSAAQQTKVKTNAVVGLRDKTTNPTYADYKAA